MSRIDFSGIRAAVTMEDVLADYSIVPQRGWAICPFHADRHPSLKVYKDSFYCYACGSGGDVITFVRRMEDVSNAQAAALIMARHGLGYGPVDSAARRRQQEQRQRQRQLDAQALAARDVLCHARRCDGGRVSEWDYWLDYLEDDPEGFFAQGGKEVIARAQRVYGGGADGSGDIRRDADDRG